MKVGVSFRIRRDSRFYWFGQLTILTTDHAVSTSLIYLTRSMGTVWGVASISTITQGVLRKKLARALRHVDGAEEVSLRPVLVAIEPD